MATNLNAPVLMMAEKLSDRIRGARPLPPSDAPYYRTGRGPDLRPTVTRGTAARRRPPVSAR
jgi:choline dehydrogenase